MQRQLGSMGGQLAILSGLVCAGVFAVGILRGQGWVQMLKSAVSLAVAAVPEGLPAVATTTLALGIQRMRRRQVAVRKLEAVETLGSVQVICLDKTGTLTLNRMSVMELYCGRNVLRMDGGRLAGDQGPVRAGDSAELRRLLEVVALCSEAQLGEGEELDGSPTENALVEAAIAGGIDVRELRRRYPREQIRYRAEDRPFMSTLHTAGEDLCLMAVKGSPGEVLERCEAFLDRGEARPLDDRFRQDIQRANERMAGEALRVLGVAFAEVGRVERERRTAGLTWLGLIGMADPLRPGMRELVADYHAAGIETVMITGDQSATAYAIGKQLGLSNGRELRILDSSSLEKLDPDLLAGLVRRVHVFSRVSPAHKLRIVQALQRSGRVVAMTGDGINDGPALKAAEIGIAMGLSGTDVARSVSDVVLEDDNLHTMHEAVRQGRTIYANIRKTIHFLLSTNFTEIEVMLAGVAFGFGQALSPMQLLWINLISDIFPGLALSLEPPEPDAMERGPRDVNAPVIGRGDLGRMAGESALITAGAVASYLYGLGRYGRGPRAGTLVFNTLTVGQLLHALSCRSAQETLFSARRRPPNPYLNWALGGSLAAQGVISSVPALRRLLGTSPLGLADLGVVAAGALGPLLVNEGLKEWGLRRERADREADVESDEDPEEREPQS
jgi:Ca2+-transporting ATPase